MEMMARKKIPNVFLKMATKRKVYANSKKKKKKRKAEGGRMKRQKINTLKLWKWEYYVQQNNNREFA